jgi:peptide deformylase
MSILKVAQMGHPVLRTPAREVDPETIRSDAFQRLVDDMVETLHEYDGIGLAAPQVHEPLRVCLIGVVEDAEEGEPQKLTVHVAVNPTVTALTEDTVVGIEGCLSMSDLRGLVPRRRAVRLEALDRHGEPYALELEGYPAVVAQHETDHLDGVLFIDRMPDLRSLAYGREFARYGYGTEELSRAEG